MVSLRAHLALIIFLSLLQARSAEVPWVDRWLDAQSRITNWSARFRQTRELKTLQHPLTTPGQVWFQAPNRFRWELGEPVQTIALRLPSEIVVVYPLLQTAERYSLTGPQASPMKDSLTLFEAGFPQNRAGLESRFRLEGQTLKDNLCELVLVPKTYAARRAIPKLILAFRTNDLSLAKTELHFTDGSIMRNDFTNAAVNAPHPENIFAPPIKPEYQVLTPGAPAR